jgi:hypothetical protein
LPPPEFEQFLDGALKLRRKKRVTAKQPSRREAELLSKINEVLPPEMRRRHAALYAQRDALNPDEYAELLRLSNQLEILNAQRLEYLGELARLRQTTLSGVMDELGITPPANE